MATNDWKYLGDVNPECGGYWYRVDKWFCVDIVEVIDAANMARDMSNPILVESGSFWLDFKSKDFKPKLLSALEYCGMTIEDLRKIGKESVIDTMVDVWHSYYGVYPDKSSLVRLDLSHDCDDAFAELYDRDSEIELHIDCHSDVTEWIENCWLN